MSKHQIILLAIAILLLGGLYALPKVMIENKEQTPLANEEDELLDEEESPMQANLKPVDANPKQPEGHARQTDEALVAHINSLRSRLQSSDNQEKNIIFADSLATAYELMRAYDSAAYYRVKLSEWDASPERWEAAGNVFYDAFRFSMNPENQKKTGANTRKYLNKVLEVNPDRLDLKNKVAMTMVSSSNPMQGILMLREILEADPQNEEATFNLGILSIQSGQHSKAAERFEALLDRNPEHLQAQFYLGVSYFELGKKQEALQQFELVKARDSDPAVQATADSYLEELR